ALAAGVAGGALLEVAVIRRLRRASRLVVMVATIAAAQVLSVFVIVMPRDRDYVRHLYPTPFHVVLNIGNLRLGAGQLVILLVAGTQPLSANGGQAGGLGPGLLLRALAAAMLGGLESLPLVFAGGLAIGLVEALVQWNYPAAGILNPLLFAIILVSLLIHRR